jgi:hypothetical protein
MLGLKMVVMVVNLMGFELVQPSFVVLATAPPTLFNITLSQANNLLVYG